MNKMAEQKRKRLVQKEDNIETREEYIHSLELSVQFLKNELDRVKFQLKEHSNNTQSNLQANLTNLTYSLLDCDNEIELINKTHSILSKYFSVVECNYYFRSEDDSYQPVSNTDTSVLLNNQVEHLQEQGILDWTFEEHKIKIIPNLDEISINQNSYILYPIFQSSEPIGLFLCSSALNHSSYDESIIESLEKVISISSILAFSFVLNFEKNALKRKFDIINNQLMQTTMHLSIGEIAGTIARESENPIRIANANIDLILRGIGSTQRRAEIISDNLKRLETLNKTIINLAFDENDAPKDISISKIIDETIDILAFQISGDDIKIEKAFDKEELQINCSKTQIQYLLLNLFLNARDAMPNGGVISIGCFKHGNSKVSITIADTGQGIPEIDIPNIFEPHYSKKTGSKKLALNLYMTKRIINNHKGKISFVSMHGKGTTFKILLPLSK